jgi:death-on-curing protein
MPMATYGGAYLHEDFAAKAAAYLFHICNAHAFIDGNKRAATMATLTFLDLNGLTLEVTETELVQITLGVASGATGKDVLTERLRAVIQPA